ncbi:MAG: hypothetical protein QOK10_1847, partial [Pseudonocardiales bacterium]|nr:hypothetical protein [Pseudonocardiales bacterium]
QGYSTAQIADRLWITHNTVQDHLKSIFDKTGVRSRREVMALILRDHYLPDCSTGARWGLPATSPDIRALNVRARTPTLRSSGSGPAGLRDPAGFGDQGDATRLARSSMLVTGTSGNACRPVVGPRVMSVVFMTTAA